MSRLRRISLIVAIALLVVFVAIFGVAADVGAEVPGQKTGELKGNNGTFSWTTINNEIFIKFTPDVTKVECKKIVFVQTVQRFFDTKPVAKPSDVYWRWWYRDDDTTPGGTGVDHLFCEEDPYYNGDDEQDGGYQGFSDPATGKADFAWMYDKPFYPDPVFPTGATKVTLKYETAAYCADTNTPLGSIKWEYTRTKGETMKDPVTGKEKLSPGTATVTSTSVNEAPSAEFTAALEKFKNNHTGLEDTEEYTFCPELEFLIDVLNEWPFIHPPW